jgi:hypothetical protein
MSSPLNFFNIVVLPALSSPLGLKLRIFVNMSEFGRTVRGMLLILQLLVD